MRLKICCEWSPVFRTLNFYIQWHEFCPVGEGKPLKDFKQGKKVKNKEKQACTIKKKKKKRIQQMVVKFSICKERKKKKEPWPILHS